MIGIVRKDDRLESLTTEAAVRNFELVMDIAALPVLDQALHRVHLLAHHHLSQAPILVHHLLLAEIVSIVRMADWEQPVTGVPIVLVD